MHALIAESALALSLGATLLGYSFLAQADHRIETVVAVPSIKVGYSDLDISKPGGLEVLYSRIQHAARSVCYFDDQVPMELVQGQTVRTCYRAAVDNAVKQIDRPTLTALHRVKSKQALG